MMPIGGPRGEGIAKGDVDPGAAWRHVDWLLVLATFSLAGLGSLMVYSSTRYLRGTEVDYTYFLKRQAMFCVLGVGLMAFTAAIDYRRIREFSPILYGGLIFLLLAVLTPLGTETKGTQAWFTLPGGFQLQPSEFVKIGLIVMLAAWCGPRTSSGEQTDLTPQRMVIALLLAATPLGFIMLQPDLGTALVLVAVTVTVMALAGVKARYLFALALIAVLAGTAVFKFDMLADFQKDRLTAFLDPEADARGGGFNHQQAKITIGSGGLTGRGLFKGSQTKLGYVPEQRTDFIFTAVGEQLGLVGAVLLLALFAIVMWRTWRAASMANEPAGALICGGVLAMLCFQVFENIGMNVGIMPITGIPLPFMSYGGSATLAAFAAIGLVLNVHMRRYS